jgi:hypothetical protein
MRPRRFPSDPFRSLFSAGLLIFFVGCPLVVVLDLAGVLRFSAWDVVGFLVGLAVLLALYAAAKITARRRLSRHDFLLCTQCLYPLDGVPPDSRCPECGMQFNSDEVRAAWKHVYRYEL